MVCVMHASGALVWEITGREQTLHLDLKRSPRAYQQAVHVFSMSDFENDSETHPFLQKSHPTKVSNQEFNFRRSRADASWNETELEGRHLSNRRKQWTYAHGHSRPIIILLLAFCAILVLKNLSRLIPRFDWSCQVGKHTYRPTTPPLGVPENVQHSWAQYSPYHAEGDYRSPPEGCSIDQVGLS